MIWKQQTGQRGIPWRDNSSFLTTYYSILAAMVGAILALAVGDKEIATHWYGHSGCSHLLWSASSGDLRNASIRWTRMMLISTLPLAIDLRRWNRCHALWNRNSHYGLHYHAHRTLFIFILLATAVASWKWLCDIRFLLFGRED